MHERIVETIYRSIKRKFYRPQIIHVFSHTSKLILESAIVTRRIDERRKEELQRGKANDRDETST